MNLAFIIDSFSKYGLIFLFVIVFLEYMNLPGFPAGIIMPAAGFLVAQSELNFVVALVISIIAGLLGSWVLYWIGLWGGEKLLNKYQAKFPSQKKYIDKSYTLLQNHGNKVIFISKLIPAIRTLIGFPAGAAKMKFMSYTLYSAMGICIWNTVLILGGYYFGNQLL